MAYDIRNVKRTTDLINYFSQNLGWNVDIEDFDDIEDISYDFDAEDIGLKEEAFAKISSLRQLQPLVDGQRWGIFCVEFDSNKFEVSALRKILSGLIPKRRNSVDHAVWCQQDLLFLCEWGHDNNHTIGIAHFEDKEIGLPQIKMISCAPALEDFTQIKVFEDRLAQLTWPRNPHNIEEWRQSWSSAFTTAYKQTIRDSSTLTIQLAAEAQNIRNRILDILNVESKNGYVHLLFDKFQNTLIHDMTEQQFADMYAQTIVYGLFSARCMDLTQDDFSVEEAIDCIPNTNPFLKNLMKECLGSQNKSRLLFDELEIGSVIELLKHTRTDAIIADFNRQTGGGREDPVIHFYEEFLTAYDKMQKVQRGVYYTPQPVINFIVRAVDYIIKKDFGFEDGLATIDRKKIKVLRQSKRRVDGLYTQVEDTEDVPAIQVLDPATGTGTFVRQVILQIYDNFKQKHRNLSTTELKKVWNAYVPKHLLTRVNAFELMMAPYAVAHMKLAMVLRDTGYEFEGNNRLNVYLTNSLEKPGDSDGQLTFWSDPLATESIAANAVKKNNGINIIIGNPPYNNISNNRNEWISSLLMTYKEGLNEKKINLEEDSIKFIRLGHYYAERNEKSIIAYITNNSFINGVTHRKMRSDLLKVFDKIYVLNLHGDINRREKSPDGSKDENVFDIKQGVCVVVFVRKSSKTTTSRVHYYDLYGCRDYKYEFLQSNTLDSINWKEITPQEPYFFFDDKDYGNNDEYESGFSVDDLFVEKCSGVETKNDSLTLAYTFEDIQSVLKDFQSMSIEAIKDKYNLHKEGNWTVKNAKNDLMRNEYQLIPILFRPFDVRYTIMTNKSMGFLGRPRYDIMKNMLYEFDNYALLTGRQNKSGSVDSFLVTNLVSERKCAERTIMSCEMPIFIGEKGKDNTISRCANFRPDIIEKFSSCIGLQFDWTSETSTERFTALDLLDYLYAVLYSSNYREKYKDQLSVNYPVIPYPRSFEVYSQLRDLGQKLRIVHLMRNNYQSDVEYINNNSSVVDTIKYYHGNVIINKAGSLFSNIDKDIWDMTIGGYQPLKKWLDMRKGKTLTEVEIEHFKQIKECLYDTKRIVKEIDQII